MIIQKIGLFKDQKITVIPNNTETYISFGLGRLQFLDSMRFMGASLDTLVQNLAKGGIDKFKILSASYNPEQVNLALKKLSFPYDYMDSMERFHETELPPKEAFYNILTDEHISDENYLHAQQVWDKFEIKNLGNLTLL